MVKLYIFLKKYVFIYYPIVIHALSYILYFYNKSKDMINKNHSFGGGEFFSPSMYKFVFNYFKLDLFVLLKKIMGYHLQNFLIFVGLLLSFIFIHTKIRTNSSFSGQNRGSDHFCYIIENLEINYTKTKVVDKFIIFRKG